MRTAKSKRNVMWMTGTGGLLLMSASASASVELVEYATMRDGVKLETRVYLPDGGGVLPTILIRSPYGNALTPEITDPICDGFGFALVSQDTRGRYESEGVDDVFQSDGWGENQDGYDTIDWIINQQWSDGNVGMIGASALGITTYLAAGALHPALKAAHVGIAPWIFYNVVYQGGAYRTGLVDDWLEGQDAEYMIDTYHEHPTYDELWQGLDMRSKEDYITIPIFHYGGWYDVFTSGPLDAFSALQNGGAYGYTLDQRLIMGPWTHVDEGAWSVNQGELTYPTNSLLPLTDLDPIGWFEVWLKGAERSWPQDYPVRIYVMGDVDNPRSGANHWEEAREWPIPSEPMRLYFKDTLELEPYPADGLYDPIEWIHDPANPSPTIGGGELSLPAGPRDQRALADRSDLVVFETDPLDTPVKAVGDVKAHLFVSSDAEDTDFTVRLVDVYPDGRAMLVTDGILKARYREGTTSAAYLDPEEVYELSVDVGNTAISFGVGHKIQVIVGSSNAPRFEPTKNLAGDLWTDAAGVPALNKLYVDDQHASYLELPIPKAGTLRFVPAPNRISPTLVRQARAALKSHRPLSDAQRDALRVDAGGALMKYLAQLEKQATHP